MIEIDVKKDFFNKMSLILAPLDTNGISHKVADIEYSFNKFLPLVNKLIRYKIGKNGIDFGCGNCALIILGGIMGFNITGVDIPFYDNLPTKVVKENQYRKVHDIARISGYSIVEKIEYKVDFITSYLSINDDYSSYTNKLKTRKFHDRLLYLLSNISDGGALIVGPRKKFLVTQNAIELHKDLKNVVRKNNIAIINWDKKRWKSLLTEGK